MAVQRLYVTQWIRGFTWPHLGWGSSNLISVLVGVPSRITHSKGEGGVRQGSNAVRRDAGTKRCSRLLVAGVTLHVLRNAFRFSSCNGTLGRE